LTYSVRRMVKEDLEQVNAIDREAFPTQWPPANYQHELQNKIAHYIVASDDARTITIPVQQNNHGFWRRLLPWVKKLPLPETEPPPPPQQYLVGFAGIWMMVDEAHITNVAVRGEYRGQGIGELLMIASIDLAGELQASFLTLEVRASNLTAQGLYRKYGFVQMGVRRGYYLDNREDAIIMSTEPIAAKSYQKLVEGLRESLQKRLV
jgi:[ribosomal protein S18]-alanine N-acetyltransferase